MENAVFELFKKTVAAYEKGNKHAIRRHKQMARVYSALFQKKLFPCAYIPQQGLALLPEKKTTKSKNEFTAYLKKVF